MKTVKGPKFCRGHEREPGNNSRWNMRRAEELRHVGRIKKDQTHMISNINTESHFTLRWRTFTLCHQQINRKTITKASRHLKNVFPSILIQIFLPYPKLCHMTMIFHVQSRPFKMLTDYSTSNYKSGRSDYKTVLKNLSHPRRVESKATETSSCFYNQLQLSLIQPSLDDIDGK